MIFDGSRIPLIVISIFITMSFSLLSSPISNLIYAQSNFINPINISDSKGMSIDQRISVSGNNVYVVWKDNVNGIEDVFFSKSSDNGFNFTTPINLSNTTSSSFEPKVYSIANYVYVFWTENVKSSNNEIFFTRSTDNGASFNKPVNLSNTEKGMSGIEEVAISGSNVYIAFRDSVTGDPEIFFTRSTDNGASFNKPVNISNNDGLSGLPKVSASGNTVNIVWEDTTTGNDEILLSTSTDNGASFNKPVNISNNTGYSSNPKIATSANNVYVTWQDRTKEGTDIFYSRSTDKGINFAPAIDLTKLYLTSKYQRALPYSLLGPSSEPSIIATGSNVFISWQDNNPGNDEILLATSTDNGASFNNLFDISGTPGFSTHSQIAGAGNNVYVIWEDTTPGNAETMLVGSRDNGFTFTSPINLSNDSGPSISPTLIVADDKVYTAWQDATLGNREIFFSTNNDAK
jgi:hypothetical protein